MKFTHACSALLFLFALAATPLRAEIQLREIELKTKLGVGYAVKLVDVNEDKRPDIVIVDQKRMVWLENPNWEEHVLIEGQTRPDNVCTAAADIDGDGHVDFAVGADWKPADTKAGGTLQWIRRGPSLAEKWTLTPIGETPTLHRMEFANLSGDDRPELIVAPLQGQNSSPPEFADKPVRVLSYAFPKDPVAGPWQPEVLCDDVHVSHNFQAVDLNGDGKKEVLLASAEGVSLIERTAEGAWKRRLIGAGNQEGKMPLRGASEVKLGRLKDKSPYIATIEPWHGHQVVVYTPPAADAKPDTLWTRHVLDEQLKWGHAVWCANLDGDADDELIVGVRDNKDDQNKSGLRIYDPTNADPAKWTAQRIDPGGVAIEDLIAGDLNADGRADVVAVGRATHNVKIYWNETK